MAASKPALTELVILLVGKTGNGKSSSGNSILGQDVFFTSDSGESVTSETVLKFGKRGNYMIKIVDTPGVLDTRLSDDKKMMVEYTIEKLSESFYHCPMGFHAIVLVLRYPPTMADEEIEAVNQLRKIFGEDFIKNHCIIIITNGEMYDLDARRRSHESFEKWCEVQDGTFGYLVGECRYRVVLFYNLCDDDRTTMAVDKFFSLVANIESKYTNDEFDKWKRNRDELIVRTGLVQLKDNLEPKIDFVVNKLSEIKASSDCMEVLHENLRMLKVDVQDLKTEIDNEDRETGVLISLKKIVTNHMDSIDRAMLALNKAITEGMVKENVSELQMLYSFLERLARIQEQGRNAVENRRRELAADQGSNDLCIIS